MAGVTPSLAVFLLLLVGALLGAATGAAAVWWHNRRQLRYLQPQSPWQALYATSLQVVPRAFPSLATTVAECGSLDVATVRLCGPVRATPACLHEDWSLTLAGVVSPQKPICSYITLTRSSPAVLASSSQWCLSF